SVYADGELPAPESIEVEAHLADCDRCRALVDGLRLENRMIGEVLAEARDERATLPEWQPASPSRLLFGALAALAGVILGLRSIFVGVASWGVSEFGIFEPLTAALDWLNPAGWSARLNLLFSSVFYL